LGPRARRESAIFGLNLERALPGTLLAELPAMAPRRAHQAAIAAASDGSVLINVVGLLPEDVQERLGEALGTTQLFVGVPLAQREAAVVVSRLDGAAAEASAHLLGGRAVASTAKRAAGKKPSNVRAKSGRKPARKRR
jgi:hypothetical protein